MRRRLAGYHGKTNQGNMMRTERTLCLLGLSAVLSAGQPAVAQDGARLGVLAAVNRSTMVGAFDAEGRFSGQMGLYATVPVGRSLAIRPELSVAWRRVGSSTFLALQCPIEFLCTQSLAEVDEVTSTSWLEVPILVELALPAAGSVRPILTAGPYGAIRLACSYTTSVPNAVGTVQSCRDGEPIQGAPMPIEGIPPNRKADAGLVVGAGFRAGAVGVGFRWTQSLVVSFPEARFGGLGATPLSGGRYSTVAVIVDVGGRLD